MFKKLLLLMIVCFTMSCATIQTAPKAKIYDIMKDTDHVIVSYKLHDIHGGAPETQVIKERAYAVLPNVVITWLDKEYAMTALRVNNDGVYNGRRAMYFATSITLVVKVYIIAEDQEPYDVSDIPERVQEALVDVIGFISDRGGIDAVIKQEQEERIKLVNNREKYFDKQVDDILKSLPKYRHELNKPPLYVR